MKRRWPWWRRRAGNGEAKTAAAEAEDQLKAAHEKTPHVDRTTRAAEELVRRTDRFAREVERSMRLHRGSTW